jgi:branched-chain amino acid transport system permease protein
MGLQMLINAILLGGLYALMGIGFSLQWGISGIINLSYGAMVILGSYISLEFFNLYHIDPFISIISWTFTTLSERWNCFYYYFNFCC